MPKGNQCCPHASLQLASYACPCSSKSRQLLPHTTALKAALSWTPARLLPKRLLPAEEEAEAELSWEVGSACRHGNLLYIPSIEENLPQTLAHYDKVFSSSLLWDYLSVFIYATASKLESSFGLELLPATKEQSHSAWRLCGTGRSKSHPGSLVPGQTVIYPLFPPAQVSEMNPTSQFLGTTEYDYGYDENTAPCNEGNNFSRFKSLFLPILYCLVFVFCLLGNSLVLWVLLTRKKLTTMTDICLLNLAASDLLFVVPLPFQAHYASDEWVFGNAMCKIMAGIYYTGFYSSIFFITLMSIDRYIAIVHAVYAMRIRTATCGIIISLILWLVAGLASIPNIMFNEQLEIEQSVQCVSMYPPGDNTWKIASQFAANILGLLIPLSILICCYAQILKNLQKCKNRNKIKAIKMIFIIVIVFFLFWTPFNIALFLDSLQSLHIINDCKASYQIALALQLTETISFIHCCLNPVIYAFAGVTFKAHLKELLQSCVRLLSTPVGSAGAGQSFSVHTQLSGYSDSTGFL
ncbi:c-c chemokine receptor type 8-like [Limosa lapponica baueri]|uniref:C-c chemokine receptor type 8-like n=1 Tax=Limosa lapponica baueri TaxID=1758121 RepID=A0A2I0TWE4_LIMLA|nr:c-c chemokine receptor type 8-like [Limosa lapponica baueri]